MQLGGKPPQLFDQARDGIVDVAWTLLSYTPGRFPIAEVFELPFMGGTATQTTMALQEFQAKHLGDELAVRPPYYSQRNFGSSALEWCYVAAGRLDVYIHGGQMLWDYAAGRLILEEAGGSYSSLGGTPLTAGPAIKRSVIAAASPALFEQWRTWLHAHA